MTESGVELQEVDSSSHLLLIFAKVSESWHVPGGPVVKTSPSSAAGAGLIPGQGAKIPHASWPENQNIETVLWQIQ